MLFAAVTTSLFAALAAATASQKIRDTSDQTVTLTYWAAADNTYTAPPVTVDGDEVEIASDLSFTYISSDAPYGVQCASYGIDGAVTTLDGSVDNVPIGPPQVQLYAKCWYA